MSTIRRLYESLSLDRKNSWLAGVCAGIANTLNMEPAYVRIGFVILAVFFPMATIAGYIVLWILLNDR